MAFYWGQGVGLPRIPPAFLLLPNTLKALIPCDFWFMCCFGLAPPGKPRPVPPSCFSQSHQRITSALCTTSRQLRLQAIRNYQELKNTQRERRAECNIHKASKGKNCLLLEQTKPFCSYAKSRSCTTFCWGTGGMREILFIQLLISLLRLKLFFCRFICSKLLFCKTSNSENTTLSPGLDFSY